MRFIDLFAGLGGFHIALKRLGHRCVFACEINKPLAELYENNFGLDVEGDIRQVPPANIPKHDILCAGFPCQPFSKAGMQRGLGCGENGTLFDELVDILAYHRPSYFILENVPHIKQHDNEKTWKYMVRKLQKKLKYSIDYQLLSPHQFGIPQHRERLFIVGAKKGLGHFEWPRASARETDVQTILDRRPSGSRKIGKREGKCLRLWQRFLDALPSDENLSAYPVWSMEFGATYPFEDTTPHSMAPKQLEKYRGCFGTSLKGLDKKQQLGRLPSYARIPEDEFPVWKQDFIRWNRELYARYRNQLEGVVGELRKLQVPSWQKFEWNCNGEARVIRNQLIQFRASGIRVRRTASVPSLVCTATQVPIVGWKGRYLTKYEAAKLQSMKGIKLPESDNACFRALGNAVNAEIVYRIAKALVR